MPFDSLTSREYGYDTRFKKGQIPWWTEKGVEHPMKNLDVAKQVSETKKKLFKEGKLKSNIGELGKKQKGSKNHMWKGDKISRHANGYLYVRGGRNRIALHRFVMEESIGRPLKKFETVHHIDGDINNCEISNLFLCESQGEHNKIHGTMESCMFELVRLGIVNFNKEKRRYEIAVY